MTRLGLLVSGGLIFLHSNSAWAATWQERAAGKAAFVVLLGLLVFFLPKMWRTFLSSTNPNRLVKVKKRGSEGHPTDTLTHTLKSSKNKDKDLPYDKAILNEVVAALQNNATVSELKKFDKKHVCVGKLFLLEQGLKIIIVHLEMLWRVQRVLPNPVLSCSDINDVFTNLASEQGINLDKPKNSKEIDIFWQSMMPLFFDLEKTSEGFGLIQSQELRERVLDILRNGLLVKALKLSNKAAKTSQNMTMDEYIDGLLQKFKATYPEWRCLPFPRLG